MGIMNAYYTYVHGKRKEDDIAVRKRIVSEIQKSRNNIINMLEESTLSKQKEAAIVNVSSGLGFVPMAWFPVYCATKAAVHSFSLSLRHQLRNTSVKIFEIIPPMVDTELDKGARGGRGQQNRGIPPAEVAVATLKALENNEYEVAVGMADSLRMGARNNPEETFQNMNQ